MNKETRPSEESDAFDLAQYMRTACSMRGSVLSSNLLQIRRLHELTERAVTDDLDRTRLALAEAHAAGLSGNARLNRELDVAAAHAYPLVSRPALFAVAYGQTEFELEALCRTATPAIPNALRLDELRGNSLEQMKLYLGKVVGVEMPLVTEWATLADYANVRNVLLHSRGFFSAGREPQAKRVRAFAKRLDSLEIVEITGRVILSESFLPVFCDSVGVLWRQLEEAWSARWKQ